MRHLIGAICTASREKYGFRVVLWVVVALLALLVG
jgi:hypothetical protein